MNRLSNSLPCRSESIADPEGVHGEMVLPIDCDIEVRLWELLRAESRRSGYRLGATLTHTVEWRTDAQQCVSFEVLD